jgi:hypothetical protein
LIAYSREHDRREPNGKIKQGYIPPTSIPVRATDCEASAEVRQWKQDPETEHPC